MALEWSFGDRIRKIRRASGLNQSDFGARIGHLAATVSAWESGRNEQPRGVVAIAKRIELAFGVPATWTLGLTSTHPGGPDEGEGLPRVDSNHEPAEERVEVGEAVAPVIPLFPTTEPLPKAV